jgi:hypothetical protein
LLGLIVLHGHDDIADEDDVGHEGSQSSSKCRVACVTSTKISTSQNDIAYPRRHI